MMLFVLLAILALVYDRLVLAFALIVTSALVKFATLPLLPLFFIYGIAHQPTYAKTHDILSFSHFQRTHAFDPHLCAFLARSQDPQRVAVSGSTLHVLICHYVS